MTKIIDNKFMLSSVFCFLILTYLNIVIIGFEFYFFFKLIVFFISNLCLGCFFLNSHKKFFQTITFYYICCFLIGAICYLLLGFIFLHEVFYTEKFNYIYVVFLLLLPFKIIGIRQELKSELCLELEKNILAKIIILATMIWTVTYAGFKPMPFYLNESDLPADKYEKVEKIVKQYYVKSESEYDYELTTERVVTKKIYSGAGLLINYAAENNVNMWSNPVDKIFHLSMHIREVSGNLFPLNHKNHRGIQTYSLTAAKFSADPKSPEEIYYTASKVSLNFIFLFWFFLIYGFYFLAKKIYKIPDKYQKIIILSPVFFEAIPLITKYDDWGVFSRLYSLTSCVYYNTPHLMSLAIAIISVILVHLSAKSKNLVLLNIAALFIFISFFFKPSAYIVLAPAFCFYTAISGLFDKEKRWSYILPFLIILLVPLYYLIYPFKDENITATVSSFAMSPFFLVEIAAYKLFGQPEKIYPFFLYIYLYILPFAFFMPFLISRLPSFHSVVRANLKIFKLSQILAILYQYRLSFFSVIPLILGLIYVALFYEVNHRFLDINFSWPFGVSFFLVLPLLYRQIFILPQTRLKTMSIYIIYLHLFFGLMKLFSFLLFIIVLKS